MVRNEETDNKQWQGRVGLDVYVLLLAGLFEARYVSHERVQGLTELGYKGGRP